MLARCFLVVMLATALLAPTVQGQVEERETSETLKISWIPECESGMFPVPMNFAGMEVKEAQAVLDDSAGGLQIAIADPGCDSLREPTMSEQGAIIKGPASPCGNPGTCISSGGLVGVILEPTELSMMLKVILVAGITALIVSLGRALVVMKASRTR